MIGLFHLVIQLFVQFVHCTIKYYKTPKFIITYTQKDIGILASNNSDNDSYFS